MANKVVCRYCGQRTVIPTCKPDHRAQVTLAYLATKNWQFFGRGKGSCPDCNFLEKLDEPVTKLEKIGCAV